MAEPRILPAAPVDTRPRTPLISFCTVQLRTLCAAHSLVTLYLSTTSGPDPEELPGFWGLRHAPIPRKGSGKQQQQQQNRTLARKKGIIAGPWRGKAGLHEGRFYGKETRASKENLPR